MPATFAAAYPYLEEINFVQFLFILFIAVSGTTAQTLLNSALKRGDLSFLLPLDFLRLIWSALLGIALFGESTSVFLWLGGLFILGATTLIVTSEKKKPSIIVKFKCVFKKPIFCCLCEMADQLLVSRIVLSLSSQTSLNVV